MISVGAIVRAEVIDVQDRGVHVRCDGVEGFVAVIDLTWRTGRVDPRDFATVGGHLDVRVHAVTSDRFYASLRAVHPEDDPWRDPARYAVGTRHRGVVRTVVDFGAFIELEAGAIGRLADAGALAVGDTVDVLVAAVDVEWRKLALALA